MIHAIHPGPGAAALPAVPPYLAPVFDNPILYQRAQAIVAKLADVPEDTALAALAFLAEREVLDSWPARVLNGAAWMLLNHVAFDAEAEAPGAWEGRAAA